MLYAVTVRKEVLGTSQCSPVLHALKSLPFALLAVLKPTTPSNATVTDEHIYYIFIVYNYIVFTCISLLLPCIILLSYILTYVIFLAALYSTVDGQSGIQLVTKLQKRSSINNAITQS